jgi:hypothetical protein
MPNGTIEEMAIPNKDASTPERLPSFVGFATGGCYRLAPDGVADHLARFHRRQQRATSTPAPKAPSAPVTTPVAQPALADAVSACLSAQNVPGAVQPRERPVAAFNSHAHWHAVDARRAQLLSMTAVGRAVLASEQPRR